MNPRSHGIPTSEPSPCYSKVSDYADVINGDANLKCIVCDQERAASRKEKTRSESLNSFSTRSYFSANSLQAFLFSGLLAHSVIVNLVYRVPGGPKLVLVSVATSKKSLCRTREEVDRK